MTDWLKWWKCKQHRPHGIGSAYSDTCDADNLGEGPCGACGQVARAGFRVCPRCGGHVGDQNHPEVDIVLDEVDRRMRGFQCWVTGGAEYDIERVKPTPPPSFGDPAVET